MAPSAPASAYQYPNEAFVVMTYRCRNCGYEEPIWNSRDGVTPFIVPCRQCGGDAQDRTPRNAQPRPGYQPEPGERILVSTVDADYREAAERAWDRMQASPRHALPPSARESWIEAVYQDARKRVGEPKVVYWFPERAAMEAELAALRIRLDLVEGLLRRARPEIGVMRYGRDRLDTQAALCLEIDAAIGPDAAAGGGGAS